ncbi:Retrovirus-related Pol polyprotein from transposon 412 [Vitis vinifera]|uniref:Retrovirus-related Pol polyprotein from transposon 412 n=1 Tax=Vitis vinifera TaxID=29760 RepID=A0A438E7T9_VITVI|nr:Retrovirus-related Pol polyprotein from transposon 412 [Vitis vinifera]
MEHYFKAIALTGEATKVRTATSTSLIMLLYGGVEDVAYLARKNMKRLKHTGSIREYVKEFSMLMLEIPNMFEEELLFNFMHNLQSWAKQELRRRGVQDLATTMAVVESFGVHPKEGSSKTSSGKDGKGKDKRNEFTPRTNCFLCDGPHLARDCPKRKALNAMIEERKSRAMLRWATKALVDTGATSNFVSEDEAKRLELQASKGGWLKAVNSAAKPSHEVVRGVTMHIGSWKGRVDFTVALMDDFKMVLGMDFLQKVKVVPLPFLRSMAILEEEKPCMVLRSPKVAQDPYVISYASDGKEQYPIPLIADLFDQLGKARYFTKLGLKVRLLPSQDCGGRRAEDHMCDQVWLIRVLSDAFRTHQCLSNVRTLMNKIFHPYLDKFVVVYLDDIIIYSNTLKEHVEHLRKVFKILRQNELYVNKEKCSFANDEVSFLGHRIKDGKLMMDDSKFIKGYSTRAAPFTDLLKKNKAWEWDERCQQAFKDLKKVVMEEPGVGTTRPHQGF